LSLIYKAVIVAKLLQVIDPAIAQAELAKRTLARRHLVDFSEYVSPWYHGYRHHRLVGLYLEQVADYIRSRGKKGIGRLMITMPPRHGKTEQCSRQFPAWLLGLMPDTRIILTSYNGDRANANSRGARDLVMDPRYGAVFGMKSSVDAPVDLSSDSRSVTAWDLANPHRGGVVAAGVGGGITGTGAHLMVVDDPLRGREEAESRAQRDRVWDWWTSTAYTRLEDGGAVVLIMTRWHPDDLAGRLLQQMASDPMADQWQVVNLPAIWPGSHDPAPQASGTSPGTSLERVEPAQLRQGDGEPIPSRAQATGDRGDCFASLAMTEEEDPWPVHFRDMLLNGVWVQKEDPLGRKPGEALWPEKYSEEDLLRIQTNVGAHDWISLYQQSPIQREGAMFKPEWVDVVDRIPGKVIARVRYWDKAGTEGGGDYSAGVLMAMTNDKHFYIEHVKREQLSFYVRNQTMAKMIDADGEREGPVVKTYQEVEPGAAGKEAAANTVKEMQGRGIIADPVGNKSKDVRAMALSTACEAGLVHLVRAEWNQKFMEELMMFPKGVHDDQVDAAAGAYNKLARGGRSGVF
jgi:predicted phage terminase large subunit-like protein